MTKMLAQFPQLSGVLSERQTRNTSFFLIIFKPVKIFEHSLVTKGHQSVFVCGGDVIVDGGRLLVLTSR